MIRTFDFARDYEGVIHLWRNAGPGVSVGPSDSPEAIQQKLSRDPDLFLVAEQGGRLVGAVIGGYDGRRGLVYHLAVLPDSRGNGIGTALMKELEARFRAKGCQKFYLLIRPDNLEVMGFYRRLGWQDMPVHIMGKVIT